MLRCYSEFTSTQGKLKNSDYKLDQAVSIYLNKKFLRIWLVQQPF